MKLIKGNITEGIDQPCIIMHGCNCFHTMGAGVARYLANKWPEVLTADKMTPYGAIEKLGTISTAFIRHEKSAIIVANCYTQYRYGRKHRHANYEAIYRCLEEVKAFSNYHHIKNIRSVKIGCSLAGGDWRIVEAMFKVALPNATIYTL